MTRVLRIARTKVRSIARSWRGRCPRGGVHRKALTTVLRSALYRGYDGLALALLKIVPDVSVEEMNDDAILHLAARGVCLQATEWLLRRGTDARVRNGFGEETIHMVVCETNQKKDEECANIMTLLLSFGADPNIKDRWGDYPLHDAVKRGMRLTVERLLARTARYGSADIISHADEGVQERGRGADGACAPALAEDAPWRCRTVINARDVWGRTALHWVQDEEIIRLLLTRGCDPNLVDNEGRTVLHIVIGWREDCVGTVELLLEHGARTDIPDKLRRLPLHLAWSTDVVALLLRRSSQKTDVNARDILGRTPLHEAVAQNSVGAVKMLLEHGSDISVTDHEGRLPLHHARRAEDVVLLLGGPSRAAHVKARDRRGRTPLREAVEGNFAHAVKALLEHGSDPDDTNEDKCPLLHHAASRGYAAVVELLLKNKTTVDARDENGRTALHLAKDDTVLRLLLAYGCDPNLTDDKGRTVLHRVAGWSDSCARAVELLLAHGARVNVADGEGRLPLHLARSAEAVDSLLRGSSRAADVEARDRYGRTAFHDATIRSALDAMEALLARGSALDASDCEGSTLLHHAAFGGYASFVKVLLENGTPVAARDAKGRTALHMATKRLREEVIEILLDHGADATARDSTGRTPLDYLEREYDWSPSRYATIKDLLKTAAVAGGGSAPEQRPPPERNNLILRNFTKR